jgi:CubicO group peptidase (beta-lactamase class C family)
MPADFGPRLPPAGLAGLLVVANGTEYRNTMYGSYTSDTVIPIASASKWLTAATMMTLVDEGKVSLEDPVSKFLPDFTGTTGNATLRQLLSHTAGIAQTSCIWEAQQTLEQCVRSVASQKPAYEPGTKFSYGNTTFSVAGRIIEVVSGQSFEKAFESRIAKPLGMKHTRFDGNYYPTESNPVPAASAESTLNDYGNFVEMIFNRGEINGTRVLSEHSVLEMETDSVKGLNTSSDTAVLTTGIPTYGLGTWRDATTKDDVGVVTSGNGAYGFYPWVDRSRNGYGIIFVFDQRGSDVAVPESQREMHWVWAALDNLGVPQTPTPTTTYGR